MQSTSQPRAHKNKLLLVISVIVLLVLSFFIYKYAYIYNERRKYDKATVAIQKVADELRSQGIQTVFSRGCGRTQEVYSKGTLTCSVGITYTSSKKNSNVKDTLLMFSSNIEENSFRKTYTNIKDSNVTVPSGSNTYATKENSLQCNLTYSGTYSDSRDKIDFYCVGTPIFNLY